VKSNTVYGERHYILGPFVGNWSEKKSPCARENFRVSRPTVKNTKLLVDRPKSSILRNRVTHSEVQRRRKVLHCTTRVMTRREREVEGGSSFQVVENKPLSPGWRLHQRAGKKKAKGYTFRGGKEKTYIKERTLLEGEKSVGGP